MQRGEIMKCIKRNGQEVEFNNEKSKIAITKANNNIDNTTTIANTIKNLNGRAS